MPIDVALFKGIEMFELLDDDDRQAVADVVDAIKLNAGQTLFRRASLATHCSVVRQGSVELFIKDTAGQRIVLYGG